MNSRTLALVALIAGLVGAALAAVAWPAALVLGGVAIIAAFAVMREKSIQIRERGFALGALALGAAALVLGAVVGIARSDGNGEAAPPNGSLSYIEGVATGTPDALNPPQADVQRVLDCRVEIGGVIAGGSIKNNTSTPVNYSIIVVWEEDGRQIARNTTLVANVVPGLATRFTVSAPGDGSQRTTCRTERVDRTSVTAPK